MLSVKKIMLCCAITHSLFSWSQFAPAAGEEGTTAIHKDSSIFVAWAAECNLQRGYVKISDTTFTFEENNLATSGQPEDATGKADGMAVSMGDAGTAILQFLNPVTNGEGPDFAVFENGFQSQESPYQYFLELAFVEVSSDGERFVRFPAYSNTPEAPQIGAFGQIDPSKIHNLAGKYSVFYGTPFDLDELKDSTGLDINTITHIKIIDVVGSVTSGYARYETQGRVVNDPWPTPFASCGFDLDALGIIHEKTSAEGLTKANSPSLFSVYPNPASEYILISEENIAGVEIYDITGNIVLTGEIYSGHQPVSIAHLAKGIYIIRIVGHEKQGTIRFVKK